MSDQVSIEKIKADFPRQHSSLMHEPHWDERHTNLWDIGVDGRLDIMTKEEARPLGIQIDFFPEQVDATEGMFNLAMYVQSNCLHISRDDELEKTAFSNNWNSYFPDELFIDTRQLPQAFRELIIKPAKDVARYQIAMGRLIVGHTSEEAIE